MASLRRSPNGSIAPIINIERHAPNGKVRCYFAATDILIVINLSVTHSAPPIKSMKRFQKSLTWKVLYPLLYMSEKCFIWYCVFVHHRQLLYPLLYMPTNTFPNAVIMLVVIYYRHRGLTSYDSILCRQICKLISGNSFYEIGFPQEINFFACRKITQPEHTRQHFVL